MTILENPNPIPTHVCRCKKCSCKFEYTENDIKRESWNDAEGRLGGVHQFSSTDYVNCPNCGERITIRRKAGYADSTIEGWHLTEDYDIEKESDDNSN